VANREWTVPGEGTLTGSTEGNLTGFSSNAHWADPECKSHVPVIKGPKDGFHDPIAPEPARQELEGSGQMVDGPDDKVGGW